MLKIRLIAAFISVSGLSGLAQAQHVITLKNGRQITAQSYREEGSTVKIQGLGGEFGIPKEQIQSISRAGQSDRPGLNVMDMETPARQTTSAAKPTPAVARESKAPTIAVDPSSSLDAEEAKEYQRRLGE